MTDEYWKRLTGSVRAMSRTRAVMSGVGLLLLAIVAVNRAADKPGVPASPPAPQAVRVEAAVAARRDVPVKSRVSARSRPSTPSRSRRASTENW